MPPNDPKAERDPGVSAEGGKEPNDKFIQETLEFWQPRTSRKLTEEDARQIIENTVGFFRLLHKWSRAERTPQNGHRTADEDGR